MPHPKKDTILMRFATNSDKKVGKKRSHLEMLKDDERKRNIDNVSKNPWGDLCKSWGVYDHQEIFQRKLPNTDYEEELKGSGDDTVQIKNKRLAMRLGKRSQDTINNEDSNSDSEWKKRSKAPRMRMHADDEESKKQKNTNMEQTEVGVTETYAPLSIEVINTKITYTPRDLSVLSDKFKSHSKSYPQTLKRHSVRSRLGAKIQQHTEYSSDDESASESSDYNEQIMSRVQKIDNVSKSSVWTRLEEKQQEKSDLRLIIKNRHKNNDDLRSRLGKIKQSNLRIEIDNDVLT